MSRMQREGNLGAEIQQPIAHPHVEQKHLACLRSFGPLYLHLCEMAHYQQTNQLALLSEHPLVIIRDSTGNPPPGTTALPSS